MALLRIATSASIAAVIAAVGPVPGVPQSLTQDEAMLLAFPEATDIERRTAYLDGAQLDSAGRWAGPDVEVRSGIVTHYVATRDIVPLGVAYFDAHRVRTLPEVLMIVVDPESRVRRIEVLSFREPPEYRAPAGWLAQFDDEALDGSLSLRGDIANMTGATLTSNAVTRAVRRVLALHRVIDPFRMSEP